VNRKLTIDPGLIADDTPLRLDAAAAIEFPDGSLSASGLRREAAKGRLIIERITGKDYVTKKAIKEMRERCRAHLKGLTSGFGQLAEINPAPSRAPDGSSRTVDVKAAQAAALETVRKLKENSQNTSRRNTRRPGASVISLKSRLVT
jgi:hypothetical protein